jgi:hypothetical protein
MNKFILNILLDHFPHLPNVLRDSIRKLCRKLPYLTEMYQEIRAYVWTLNLSRFSFGHNSKCQAYSCQIATCALHTTGVQAFGAAFLPKGFWPSRAPAQPMCTHAQIKM